ncbi:MAG: hypothetical protein KGM49_06735 [Sphingomonadales bacterium]|nr:hypothetical protein [Sphingomonadales bacterium]
MSGGALLAQSGPWGSPGWDRPGWDRPGWDHGSRRSDRMGHGGSDSEGRIDVARFRAEGAAAAVLGKGAIAVVPMPEGAGGADLRQDATFQAAVESELVHAGYTTVPSAGGQVAEVRIVRSEISPAEPKRKPLSGEMTMGVSNRGSMMGMALAYDATKPRTALISTLLEARIKDAATGMVLWEGRASLASREGDEKWNDTAVATRLAHALFDGFPARTGETSERR